MQTGGVTQKPLRAEGQVDESPTRDSTSRRDGRRGDDGFGGLWFCLHDADPVQFRLIRERTCSGEGSLLKRAGIWPLMGRIVPWATTKSIAGIFEAGPFCRDQPRRKRT